MLLRNIDAFFDSVMTCDIIFALAITKQQAASCTSRIAQRTDNCLSI